MPDDASAWQSLFDGQTTTGWTLCRGGPFPVGAWKVEEGCLRTLPGTYFQPDIATAQTFDNFELELEWRIAPGGNSSVFYSMAPQPRFESELHSIAVAAVVLALLMMLKWKRRRGLLLAVALLAAFGSYTAGVALRAKASGFEMQVLDDTRHSPTCRPTPIS